MDLTGIADRLRERSQARVETGYSLARFTTYRLGGDAALLFEPRVADDLALLAEALREEAGEEPLPPILILGRGSNLLVSDRGFPGIVIRMGERFSWLKGAGQRGVLAGSSTPLPHLANWAARRSLTGMEFAVSIPGSVGGAVRMNAGAHGSELAERLTFVTVFDLDALELSRRSADSLGFSYRRSTLRPNELVLDAAFQLEPDEPDRIRERMDAFREHRAATQPGAAQNAGSVFKNPEGNAAGQLVEAAGLKGFRWGGAAVSELHANFVIAGPGATAQDVYNLVHEVRRRVQAAMGVELEPEIRFVGSFEDDSLEVRG